MRSILFTAVLCAAMPAYANDFEDYQVEMETRQIYGDMERDRQHEEIMNELRMQRMQRNTDTGCDWCAPHR